MALLGKKDETLWKSLELQISVFDTFVQAFRRTAEGVRYYVNWTPEQDAQAHREFSEDILRVLRHIKESDYGAYRAIIALYKNDIKEAVKVYRESKG